MSLSKMYSYRLVFNNPSEKTEADVRETLSRMDNYGDEPVYGEPDKIEILKTKIKVIMKTPCKEISEKLAGREYEGIPF